MPRNVALETAVRRRDDQKSRENDNGWYFGGEIGESERRIGSREGRQKGKGERKAGETGTITGNKGEQKFTRYNAI